MAAGFWRSSLLLFTILFCTGAKYRTTNFIVESPDPAISEQIGQYAEHWRKVKALEWLGQEMPNWPEPCPITVKITLGGSGGATSFVFDQGKILGIDMQIEGSLDRLLASVLPHEITHTVFAHKFKRPLPRWADEGGCVISEDDIERQRHDQMVREILNTPNRRMPLRRLFSLTEYPNDVMVLYAQGYSVSDFMVAKSNRQTFLAFIDTSLQTGWDQALKIHYGYASIEVLEEAWLQSLRQTKQPAGQLANRSPTSNVLTLGINQGMNNQNNQLPSQGGMTTGNLANTSPKNLPATLTAISPNEQQIPNQPTSNIRLGQPRFSNGKQATPFALKTN